MMPGRKPKPNALKELQGNPGKRKMRAEPKLPDGIPDCPGHLDEIAREEWNRIALMLVTSGILKQTDRAVLAAYCQIYSRWVEASKQLARFGMVLKTKTGYVAQSPYLNIVNSCLDQMRQYASELGLTPSSRGRLQVTGFPGQEEEDELDRLMKGDANWEADDRPN